MAALYPSPEFPSLWRAFYRLHKAGNANYDAFGAYLMARLPLISLLLLGLGLFGYYALYLPVLEAIGAYHNQPSHEWGMAIVHFSIVTVAAGVFAYILCRLIKAERRMVHVVNEGLVAEKYTLSGEGITCRFYDHVGLPHEFTLPKSEAAHAARLVQNSVDGNSAKTENCVLFLKENPNHAVFFIPSLHRMFRWKKV